MDSDRAADVAAIAVARGHRLLRYGLAGTELRLLRVEPHAGGLRMACSILGEAAELDLPLIGAFQAGNLLAALGLVVSAGLAPARALSALSRITGVPGRMQLAARHPSGAGIYVDYAHKPDALETALLAARAHCGGRLALVFGCGGDRDRGKRPLMGEIAARLADRVYVTDDNPRSETPAEIRAAIMVACPGAVEIGDRRAAIRRAVAALGPGDVLLIAGKGHEQGQIVGDEVRPFDDAGEACAAVSEAAGTDSGAVSYRGED